MLSTESTPTHQAIVERVAEVLVERGQTLAVVECTLGGALGAVLTARSGASAWFVAAVAPYAAVAKQRLLGLDGRAFEPDGAVSPRAAGLLAAAARERLGADWVLAETGIAGPRGPRRSAKAPGTVHLHLVGPGVVRARTVETGLDDREANRRAFLAAALDLLSGI